MELAGSTVSGNSAQDGGGISGALGSSTTVLDSTLSGNSAADRGGAIDSAGSLTLTNTTIAGNSAAIGGGIEVRDSAAGSLTIAMLTGVTIADNSATTRGGGIDMVPGAFARLINTIVARNHLGTAAGTPSDIAGTIPQTISLFGTTFPFVSSNNMIGTGGSGGLVNGVNGNLVGVANPGMGTLGSYGGPTQTIPLLPGSPAIDAGNNAYVTTSTDQNGFARVVNGTVDIGACEFQGVASIPASGSTPGSAVAGATTADQLAWVVGNPAAAPVAMDTDAGRPPAQGLLTAGDVVLAAINSILDDLNGDGSLPAFASLVHHGVGVR